MAHVTGGVEGEVDDSRDLARERPVRAERRKPLGVRREAATVGPERVEQHAREALLGWRTDRRTAGASSASRRAYARRAIAVVDVGEGANALEQSSPRAPSPARVERPASRRSRVHEWLPRRRMSLSSARLLQERRQVCVAVTSAVRRRSAASGWRSGSGCSRARGLALGDPSRSEQPAGRNGNPSSTWRSSAGACVAGERAKLAGRTGTPCGGGRRSRAR